MPLSRVAPGVAALAIAAATAAAQQQQQQQQQQPAVDYARYFAERTMRVDYYHTGGPAPGGASGAPVEVVSLDQVVADGPWPGSRTRLVDDSEMGQYRFAVLDSASGQLLYSRGFSSIYGEWETTAEPRTMHRTFHESLRFPWPKAAVRVVLERRDAGTGAFRELWTTVVNPASRGVNPAPAAPTGRVWTVFESGAPAAKVDLVVLGEGYTAAEMPKFHRDVRRLVDTLFATEPFRSHRGDFNVRAIDLPSAESGISRPHAGRYRRSRTGTQYSVFDSERYVLSLDNRAMRDVLSAAPYEFVAVVVNEKQYGGGGIYNLHSTVAAGTEFAPYVFVHEFGHHFAGLADEYYTSPVAYETGAAARRPEPWEPNVTALRDPARLKWRDLVPAGTPLPTPWNKAEYERQSRDVQARRARLVADRAPEADFDRLFREQRAAESRLLAANQYAGRVGAFEGAAYEATGLFRPEVDCIMFSRNPVGFCDVCRRAIERIIAMYTN
ncbi:MAG TPA: M64 family metallopeptidase [Gemmatimonadaceae bacterium]|nr:M64 family metallopeptidase [Gemmatimonadaceae bacterium]